MLFVWLCGVEPPTNALHGANRGAIWALIMLVTVCRPCLSHQVTARAAGYSLADLRLAVRSGQITSLLSVDAMRQIISSVLHGESTRHGAAMLRNGSSRAERLSKRQRV
jgi:hypothetical protein